MESGKGGNAVKKKHPMKAVIGILCVLLLVLVAAVALMLDSQSPNPIFGIFQTEPTNPTEETTNPTLGWEDPTQGEEPTQGDDPAAPTEEQLTPPEDLPPTVTLPTEKDPQTGENKGVSFPCQVPEYDLVIEKLAPYSGLYVEDGSNVTVPNVAMLLVYNDGDFPLEYTQIRVAYGNETLLFDISALPVGEKLVVQEKNGKAIPGAVAESATALVVQRANMEMSEEMVRVVDNGDNTITVQNLTNKEIPTVRVFYKYYMEEEGIFVGGIAFTVRITGLAAGANITVQPSHYTSQTSRVVMVLTYDSEV